jgi:hypothetical protein
MGWGGGPRKRMGSQAREREMKGVEELLASDVGVTLSTCVA